MGSKPYLSVKWSISIDPIINFDGNSNGYRNLPVGGAATLWGTPTYDSAKFSEKNRIKLRKIWTHAGAPTLRSATGNGDGTCKRAFKPSGLTECQLNICHVESISSKFTEVPLLKMTFK